MREKTDIAKYQQGLILVQRAYKETGKKSIKNEYQKKYALTRCKVKYYDILFDMDHEPSIQEAQEIRGKLTKIHEMDKKKHTKKTTKNISTRVNTAKNYRSACESMANDSRQKWSDVTRKFNIGYYPFIKNVETVTDNGLSIVAAAINQIMQHENVGEAFASFISNKYNLQSRSEAVQTRIDFYIEDLSDEEVIKLFIRRGLKQKDGKFYKEKIVTKKEDVEININI